MLLGSVVDVSVGAVASGATVVSTCTSAVFDVAVCASSEVSTDKVF